MTQAHKTIRLGDEHDEHLFAALKQVLRDEQAEKIDSSRAVAGSLEVSTWQIKINHEEVLVESETSMGLSITGESAIIDHLSSKVEEALNRS